MLKALEREVRELRQVAEGEVEPSSRTMAVLQGRRICCARKVTRFNNRRLPEPIGNIPPVKGGQRNCAKLDALPMATQIKRNNLRQTWGGSPVQLVKYALHGRVELRFLLRVNAGKR